MQLTGRELTQAFRVRYGSQIGTCFLYHLDGLCCFVTANHILASAHEGDNFHLQREGGWHAFQISSISRHRTHDVCAFSSHNFIVSTVLPQYKDCMMGLGEPTYVIGFPHDLINNYPGNGFVTPLVRVANFSGIVQIDGNEILILDGFNNPGYSGGPVYVSNVSGTPSLFGVVSGYRHERESHSRVYRRTPDGDEEIVPDVFVKLNSGMIQAVGLKQVNETVQALVHSNPVSATPPPDAQLATNKQS